MNTDSKLKKTKPIRQKREAASNRISKGNIPKSRFRVAKNKRGTEIQCKDDHQCQEILDGAGECIKGRCIVQFCEVDEHCPDDRHKCHEQVCIVLEKCRTDEDCGPGFVCEDGYCMPEEEGECKEDEDCPNEVYIFSSTFVDVKLYKRASFSEFNRVISVPKSILAKENFV